MLQRRLTLGNVPSNWAAPSLGKIKTGDKVASHEMKNGKMMASKVKHAK